MFGSILTIVSNDAQTAPIKLPWDIYLNKLLVSGFTSSLSLAWQSGADSFSTSMSVTCHFSVESLSLHGDCTLSAAVLCWYWAAVVSRSPQRRWLGDMFITKTYHELNVTSNLNSGLLSSYFIWSTWLLVSHSSLSEAPRSYPPE